ncbi:MAG: hypothetical protein P1U56_22710 [Saprospiraceae bacterium]|nr:hypothetical protein [Saprospiraceae bacterium]
MISETIQTLVYGQIEFLVLDAEETKSTIRGKSMNNENKATLKSEVYVLDNG